MCSGVKVLSSVEATSKSVWKSLLFKLTKNLKRRKTKRCHQVLMNPMADPGEGPGGTATPPPLPLSQGLDDRAPPASQGLDPALNVYHV